MDGGFNSGYAYAYPTLDTMSQGQYGAQQQPQQPAGAFQFGGGFTPMISDTTQGGSTYQPAPSYTTYNMPTSNTSTNNYSPSFGGYSYSSTMPPPPPTPQYTYTPPPQVRPQAPPSTPRPAQQPTTAFTDAQGRPVTFQNGGWVGGVNVNGQGYTSLQYRGFAPPQNPIFNQ